MPIGKITSYTQVRHSLDLRELPEADQHVHRPTSMQATAAVNGQTKTPNTGATEYHTATYANEVVLENGRRGEIKTESGGSENLIDADVKRTSTTVRSESNDSASKVVATKPGRLSYTTVTQEERIFQEIQDNAAREKELLFMRQLSAASSASSTTSPSHTVIEIKSSSNRGANGSDNVRDNKLSSDKSANIHPTADDKSIDKSIGLKIGEREVKKTDDITVAITTAKPAEKTGGKTVDIKIERDDPVKSTEKTIISTENTVEIKMAEDYNSKISEKSIDNKITKSSAMEDNAAEVKDKIIEHIKNKVQPLEDYESIQVDKVVIKPSVESTIQLDVRLARERELDLKAMRGQPSANVQGSWKEENCEDSIVVVTPKIVTSGGEMKPVLHHISNEEDESNKKLSQNRLQTELLREKERELTLLKEGKIKSLSINEAAIKSVNSNSQLENELALLKELNRTRIIKIEVENNSSRFIKKEHADFRLEKEVEEVNKKEKSTDCDSALIPLLCVHG